MSNDMLDAARRLVQAVNAGEIVPIFDKRIGIRSRKNISPNVSTVGDEIKAAIEKAVNIKVSCATCLGYMQSLNQTTKHDHAAIVSHLSAEFPWPSWWREKNTRRREAISDLIAHVVPRPTPVSAPISYPLKFVTTIQVGVRIAKRITPRWEETLASLKAAGFTDAKTYCEPDACVDGNVIWPIKKGPIGSFKAMCLDLLATTNAEWLLLCEDDIAVSSHVADYVRQFNLTNEVLSLYTSGTRQQSTDKWAKIRLPLIGSLALLMRRSTLQSITQSSQWANWPKHDCVDQLIHRACAEKDIPVLTHNPSLVQHTGDTAAIYADRQLTRNRVAKDWTQGGPWTAPPITVITPTGDRPEAFALCERWMSQQTYTGQIQWIWKATDDLNSDCSGRPVVGNANIRSITTRNPKV